MVERFVSLCGEENGRTKSTDKSRNVNEKVEFGLRDQNARHIQGGCIQHVVNALR
jgi:hypothetical protein